MKTDTYFFDTVDLARTLPSACNISSATFCQAVVVIGVPILSANRIVCSVTDTRLLAGAMSVTSNPHASASCHAAVAVRRPIGSTDI